MVRTVKALAVGWLLLQACRGDTGVGPPRVAVVEVSPAATTLTALGQTRQLSAVADRKSTRLNSSHSQISYAVFCLKKKNVLVNINILGPDFTCQHGFVDEIYSLIQLSAPISSLTWTSRVSRGPVTCQPHYSAVHLRPT